MLYKNIINNQNQALVIITLFCFLLHFPYLLPGYGPTTDESLYILAGKEVSEGSILYSEIYIDKPPALIYIFAFIISFCGINIQLIRFIIAVSNVLSTLMLFLITKRFYSQKEAIISAGLFSILIANPIFETYLGRTDSFMLLFSLMSLLIVLKALQESSYKYLILSGFCISISMLFKHPGVLIIPLLVFIILINNPNSNLITIEKIKQIITLSIGIIIPLIITIAIMINMGAWDDMYLQTIHTWFSFGKSRTSSNSNIYSNIIMLIQTFNYFPIIFYVSITGLLMKCHSFYKNEFNKYQETKNDSRFPIFLLFLHLLTNHYKTLILIFWITIMTFFLLITPSRISYLIVLFPPMCIMSSSVIINLIDEVNLNFNNRDTNSSNLIKSFLMLLGLILLIAPLTPDIYPGHFTGNESIYNQNIQIIEASDYLKSHTSKEDKIYTFCYLPEIYLYTGLKPASLKYGTFQPNYVNAPNAKEINDEIILDLIANKPKYIISVETSRMEITENIGTWWDNYYDVVDHIKTNYNIENIVQANEFNYWPRGDIYIWRNNETI